MLPISAGKFPFARSPQITLSKLWEPVLALLTERHLDPFRPMDLFFTSAETLTPQVPFLVDSRMRPMTAANEWLRDLTKDGATSSPQTWKTYAYHLFDFLCFLEAQQIEWTEITNDTVLNYRN